MKLDDRLMFFLCNSNIQVYSNDHTNNTTEHNRKDLLIMSVAWEIKVLNRMQSVWFDFGKVHFGFGRQFGCFV